MKILHINTFDSGGAFQAAYRLHLGLLSNNVESKMLVLFKSNSKLTHVYSFLSYVSIYQKIRQSIVTRIWNFRRLILLGTKSRSQFSVHFSPYDITSNQMVKDADIVNLHWVAEFIDYQSFFKKFNKSVVWTLHDMNPMLGGIHYQIYSKDELIKINNLIIKHKLESLQDFKSLTIVSPSKWLYSISKSSQLFHRFPHYIIPNGLDTALFKPIDKLVARKYFNLPFEKTYLIFVADSIQDSRKGFEYLKLALKSIVTKELGIIIMGSNNIELADHELFYLGYLSDYQDIIMAYSSADIFVIPSIEDNLPNTLLESQACGLPAIGFDTGGISEVIIHNKTGLLVENRNYLDLAAKISFLVDDKDIRIKMGEDARNNSIKRYNIELQTINYTDLYNNIYVDKTY